MSQRDLDDFAKRHNLTQESMLELRVLLDVSGPSLSTSDDYTIIEDPELADLIPHPIQLPPESYVGQPKSALTTTATLDSQPDDTDAPTREFPIIGTTRDDGVGRYQDLGLIGHGGMGEVRRIRDRELNRVMAMKIIRPKIQGKPLALSRFLEEAQATAQLQHPGVVPVHEMGRLGDGRIFFTMQEIRGRTFGAVISKLHQASTEHAWGTTPDGWTLRRLIESFRHACETMAYAHKRSVVHRDLKPENIMVGQHGEVLVVDWGLAKVSGSHLTPHAEEGPLETTRSASDAYATVDGAIAGTPAYMPPEQAKGEIDQIGPHSDVYALGAILYQLLSGRAPFLGGAKVVLQQLLHGPPESLRDSTSGSFDTLDFEFDIDDLNKESPLPNKIPTALVAICEKAMNRNPHKRYSNAQGLTDAIVAWLDGSMRKERALSVVDRACEILAISETYAGKAAHLAEQAAIRAAKIAPWEPDSEKISVWALEDQAEQLEHRRRVKLIEAEQLLQAALTYDSQLFEAHQELAKLYLSQHKKHEAAGHADEATRAYELLRLHVRSLPEQERIEFISYLHGSGSVTIVSEPAGAEVHIYTYKEVDRRLQATYLGQIGTTPMLDYPIGMGSYRFVLKAPGREEVNYLVNIGRQESWDGIAPGTKNPMPIYLPEEGVLASEDIYIPGGWAIVGGDSDFAALEQSRVWIDSFIVRKYPVTNKDYLEFINDLVVQGREDEAAAHIPALTDSDEMKAYYVRHDDGSYQLGEDDQGDKWLEQWPVIHVPWKSVARYCDWYRDQTGEEWRLLSEFEWEKAARGVDGRLYPWGNHVDPSWCRIRPSLPDRALLTTVDDYPTDCSPYGVRGMGGNVADWCLDTFSSAGPEVIDHRLRVPDYKLEDETSMRVFRGGIWISYEGYARTFERFASTPQVRPGYLGFRLGRSLKIK